MGFIVQFNLQNPTLLCGHRVLGSSAKAVPSLRLPAPFLHTPISKNRRTCGVICCSSFSSDWSWIRWSQHFSEIDDAESLSSVLESQLKEAIEEEDFEQAAKLKKAISEATSKDTVAEVLFQLRSAIDEERYQEASRLQRIAGIGLLGWWVGLSEESADPFGRIVRIAPGVGKYVARSYSPRQLMTGSPGSPLFEIFLIKDLDQGYVMQVVYMQPSKGSNPISALTPSSSEDNSQASDSEGSASEDATISDDVSGIENTAKKNVMTKEATEEGIKSVISFLKERIPGLKVKVMNLDISEETKEDNNSVEESVREDNKETGSAQNSDDEAIKLEDEAFRLEADEDVREGGAKPAKLFIGGVLYNKEDIMPKTYLRTPAEIKNMKRDSFVLHIPGQDKDLDVGSSRASRLKVAAIAAQGLSELMPSDVAKAFWSKNKVPKKVSKDVREIVKLALSQAEMRKRLSTNTNFSRITVTQDSLDPFDGLYVGAFGPYGTEVIQLRRKFGHWSGDENMNESSDVEFFEYVEAVKLTGDLNVPAGEVTFRAKIGRVNCLESRGIYPDELGVSASYKGQGRIAEPGFRNSQWVDGELLQLNGKGLGQHVRGAELGFLYVVPGHSFLVLFDRLKLPE